MNGDLKLVLKKLDDVEVLPDVDQVLKRRFPELERAVDAHPSTTDEIYAPMLPPELASSLPDEHVIAQQAGLWIPDSLGNKYGLHVIRRPAESAGAFTGGGMKWIHHITVSSWWQVDSMADVVIAKRAAPQVLVGGRRGVANPILYQFMPVNVAGRSLMHTQAPPTNTANAVQLEICGDVGDVPHWDEWHVYKALANVVRCVNDLLSQNVPRDLARSFNNTDRFGAQEFVNVSGHAGHMHAPPGNIHVDPTRSFLGSTLMWDLENMPDGGWPLFGTLDIDHIR